MSSRYALVLLPYALVAAPSIGTPVVNPSTVVVGHAAPVTATCQVTGALPGGVNLVRLTSTGADSQVVGVMTPGTTGAYSYSFADTETAPSQYELQCTAALTATIRRVRSTPATDRRHGHD